MTSSNQVVQLRYSLNAMFRPDARIMEKGKNDAQSEVLNREATDWSVIGGCKFGTGNEQLKRTEDHAFGIQATRKTPSILFAISVHLQRHHRLSPPARPRSFRGTNPNAGHECEAHS